MELLRPCIHIKKIILEKLEIDELIQEFESEMFFSPDRGGFCNFEDSNYAYFFEYFYINPSLELVYDELTKQLLTEELTKISKAEIRVYKKEKMLVILGKQFIENKFLNFINKKTRENFSLVNFKINYSELVSVLRDFKFNIYEISFKKLKVFGSNILESTFNVMNNNDAYNLIDKLGKDISKIKISISLINDERINLNFDCLTGKIRTEFHSITQANLELSKDYVYKIIDKLILNQG